MVYCPKHFADIHSFTPHNNPMNYESLLFLSYKYGNWSAEKLRISIEIINLIESCYFHLFSKSARISSTKANHYRTSTMAPLCLGSEERNYNNYYQLWVLTIYAITVLNALCELKWIPIAIFQLSIIIIPFCWWGRTKAQKTWTIWSCLKELGFQPRGF